MTKDSNLVIESPERDKEQIVLENAFQTEKHERSVPEHINKLCQEEPGSDSSTSSTSKEDHTEFSNAFLSLYVNDFKRVKNNLSELRRNQGILLETVQQENARFCEIQNMYSLSDFASRAKLYHSKLLQIKKDMAAIHEKSLKLKKRSLRLQEMKQREALQREQHRERELEREKQLLAKVATRISP